MLSISLMSESPTRPTLRNPLADAVEAMVSGNIVAVGILRDGRIEHANASFGELFGCRVEDLVGRVSLSELAVEADRAALSEALRRCTSGEDRSGRLEFTGLRRDGAVVVVELRASALASPGVAAVALLDVTERSLAVRRLRSMAFHDSLTDLPNRSLFLDRLRQSVAASKRSRERMALLLADLDGFKTVNDAYGHVVGDALLQVVARRLAACSRQADTVARIGGDEFAAILPAVGGPEQAAAVAERMIGALGEPFSVVPGDCRVSVSIGIALSPDHGTDIDHLIVLADTAMYESKAQGRNRFTFAHEAQVGEQPRVLLPWSESLSLGVRVIDEQHRGMVARVNEVAARLRESDPAAAAALMDELATYTELHFRTEEGLMEAFGIPNAERHRDEHRILLSDLRSLGAGLESTSVMLALQHLKPWLLRHVDSLDRELAAGLRERGQS
jgi:diguanylate cyclase (GGDEF)-like protein/hemerythrin-like metal-binding protein/PAS domain S-box-containing protein